MIALSIVSHSQGQLASRLLDCIAADNSGLVSQVIYTRNVPEDDEVERHRELPGFIVIDNAERKGFGANHNAAFRLCRAPYFCVLNPDITWDHAPFAALLKCFTDTSRDSSSLGLVAPQVRSPSGRVENTGRRLYTIGELISQKRAPRNHSANPDWLAGMFLLFRSEAFRSIGGFDERYFLYIEDVDICSRLRLQGWTLMQCTHARITHDARNTSHRSARFALWHVLGMIRYWRSGTFWRFRSLLKKERDQGARQ